MRNSFWQSYAGRWANWSVLIVRLRPWTHIRDKSQGTSGAKQTPLTIFELVGCSAVKFVWRWANRSTVSFFWKSSVQKKKEERGCVLLCLEERWQSWQRVGFEDGISDQLKLTALVKYYITGALLGHPTYLTFSRIFPLNGTCCLPDA